MNKAFAIDIETANPQRVSACALGLTEIQNGTIINSKMLLLKPVGGHAPFQSKIHGIKDKDTFDKPDFGDVFPTIREIFELPIISHGPFDKQVLNALFSHFDLPVRFEHFDTCAFSKELVPGLTNYKLKTIAKHFKLPPFKHHNAEEDSLTCARVFLKLGERAQPKQSLSEKLEFKGLVTGILADDYINYKEAYQLLYWLEDRPDFSPQILFTLREYLSDNLLSSIESENLKTILEPYK